MSMQTTGTVVECPKCKREILVERVLLGSDHTLRVIATCWTCLDQEQKNYAFQKQYTNKMPR